MFSVSKDKLIDFYFTLTISCFFPVFICGKLKSRELSYLITEHIIITNNSIIFSGIWFDLKLAWNRIPLGTRRCYDVESASLALLQRRINVMCPVGYYKRHDTVSLAFQNDATR